MRRILPALLLGLVAVVPASARGLLIPEDKTLPPLAMVHHRVNIQIEDQVAITKIEQVFRNHTDRQLEATYIFPIPKGASVNRFTMSVDGKEVSGELLKADKASKIYTDIVRRTQDPGLLEYIGNNMMRLRIFPVLPKVDQKVSLSFNAVLSSEGNLVEYVYPMKTDGKATQTLEEFSIKATIKSQHAVQNIYSPTHAISIRRVNDKESEVVFERNQALLDKDFQMFFSTGSKDIGLTSMFYRPISSENGYFMMMVSPNVEMTKSNVIPRDLVLVLDTSGSMSGIKLDQAKKAVKHCLTNLNPDDRFAVLNFSTTVTRYRAELTPSTSEYIENCKKWVDDLRPSGGTAIQDALHAAIELRGKDESRTFTVVFFTDGQPTIGETHPDKILKSVTDKNSANTRIFTFGVGDDVNATMLDQLAEQTRAVSSYVRPAEDIEVKASSLYGKISNPILANLRLTTGDNIRIEEMYPPNLPDLFHGGQIIVFGRYSGSGPAAIKLGGLVGKEQRDFVYETTFAPKTGEDKSFVEQIWARRKVGYLLDQIRINGEKKELMDELLPLANKYSIATPFTSHLIVPDTAVPVVTHARGEGGYQLDSNGKARLPAAGFNPSGPAMPGGPVATKPSGLAQPGGGFGGGGSPSFEKVIEFARRNQSKPGDVAEGRGRYEDLRLKEATDRLARDGKSLDPAAKKQLEALQKAGETKGAYDQAKDLFAGRRFRSTQTGKLGVDLSCASNNLRVQDRLVATANCQVKGRTCVELGGVWIDEGFDPKMPVVIVKAQSDAYFRILEKQPKMKDLFRLGNHLVWVTPNNTALVIDADDGKLQLSDEEIDKLFVAVKK